MSNRPQSLVVIVPCYNVGAHIEDVLATIPQFVTWVVAVDDASTDRTSEILDRLSRENRKLRIVRHARNAGVGGAMVSGFREALRLGADIVVKIDGDGQMDPAMVSTLVRPLVEGRAHYSKGNRFRHVADLQSMPLTRLVGSVILTFMTRLVSGCWHVFDVQNGFVAVTREALESISLHRIDRAYSFENSMLALLNVESWPIVDVPMPAVYGRERSSMSLLRVVFSFPFYLLRMGCRRVFLKYVVYDVSPVSVYLLVGTASLVFSMTFGGASWMESIRTGTAAPTGTVVLSMLTFLIGFSLLLQAVTIDISNSPRPGPAVRHVSESDVPLWFADSAEGARTFEQANQGVPFARKATSRPRSG